MKNLRLLLIILLSIDIIFAYTPIPASGIEGHKSLSIEIKKVCLGSQQGTNLSGPYQIRLKVFRAVLNKNNNLVEYSNVRKVRDGEFNFDDYDVEKNASGSSMTNPLITALGGISSVPRQSFLFNDFIFEVPFSNINDGIFDIPNPRKNNIIDRFIKTDDYLKNKIRIVGIEVAVVDKKQNISLIRSKVSFPNPSPYLGTPLLNDLELNENATIHKLWPQVAIMINSRRPIYASKNKHLGKGQNECDDNHYLEYELKILD